MQLAINMRDCLGAFKRFIFAPYYILCLTICGLLGVGVSALGCAPHRGAGHHDTIVNALRRLPQISDVLHELHAHYRNELLILFAPIYQQNPRAHQQRCDHNLWRDCLTIYEMSQQDRKDRC